MTLTFTIEGDNMRNFSHDITQFIVINTIIGSVISINWTGYNWNDDLLLQGRQLLNWMCCNSLCLLFLFIFSFSRKGRGHRAHNVSLISITKLPNVFKQIHLPLSTKARWRDDSRQILWRVGGLQYSEFLAIFAVMVLLYLHTPYKNY